jgi:uncharacterized SAM-binding protein YcdF (DUF218 family)
MFFIISKILYFIITPVVWIFALLLFTLFSKNPKRKKQFLLGSIVIFILFSNSFFFNVITNLWEIPANKITDVADKYDYGILLGGMSNENSKTGKYNFSPSIDRFMKTYILYKDRKINKILISGGSGSVFRQNEKEAHFLQKILLKFGVPQEDIIIDPDSKNTHENAVFTKKIIGISKNRILLISSGFHMRRASACFKHEGFKFDIFSTDPLQVANLGPDDYFIPKAEPMAKWAILIKEWIGYISYKVSGYI